MSDISDYIDIFHLQLTSWSSVHCCGPGDVTIENSDALWLYLKLHVHTLHNMHVQNKTKDDYFNMQMCNQHLKQNHIIKSMKIGYLQISLEH